MKKVTLLLVLFLSTSMVFAQDTSENQTPTPNYKLASKFSSTNLGKLVHSTTVRPH